MWMSNSISALWLIAVITGPSSVPSVAGPPGPGATAWPVIAARPRHTAIPSCRAARGYSAPRRGSAGYSLGDVVADLRGGPRRPRALAFDQVVGGRLLDPHRLGDKAEVLAQHGRRQDRGGRVGLLLAREVRGAAVHRLEHAGRGPLRVDVPARGEPDPAGHGRAEVGQDVTEEVVGHDHVEPLRVGDQEHRRRVHVAVVDGDLAELLGRPGQGPLP